MGIFNITLSFSLFLSFLSFSAGSSFVGLEKNIDKISFGLLNTQTGVSTIKSSFNLFTFNAPQFAYNSKTQQYTFVAYDTSTYDSYLITLNAASGVVVYNTSITNPPYPFGLQYDSDLASLFGQVWYPNGTATLTTINTKNYATQNVGFYFDASPSSGGTTFWNFVDCTYDMGNHLYYSLYISPNSEVLVGVNVFNGLVTLNLTLNLNTSASNVFGLQYNNNTNTFYVIGFDIATQTYDLATVDQTNGNLNYLKLFNSSTVIGTVVGVGLDNVNNVISIVSHIDYNLLIATADLKSLRITGYTKAAGESVASMLALSNL